MIYERIDLLRGEFMKLLHNWVVSTTNTFTD